MTTLTKSIALAAALAFFGGASAFAGPGCNYGHSQTVSNPEVSQQSVKTAEAEPKQTPKPAGVDLMIETADAGKTDTTKEKTAN